MRSAAADMRTGSALGPYDPRIEIVVVDSNLTKRRDAESFAVVAYAFLAMDRAVPASFAVGLPLVTRGR